MQQMREWPSHHRFRKGRKGQSIWVQWLPSSLHHAYSIVHMKNGQQRSRPNFWRRTSRFRLKADQVRVVHKPNSSLGKKTKAKTKAQFKRMQRCAPFDGMTHVYVSPRDQGQFSSTMKALNWLMIAIIVWNSYSVPLLESVCSSNVELSSRFWEFWPESHRRSRDRPSRTLTN